MIRHQTVILNTHTHTFNGPLSETIQVSRYQKVKPICIFSWLPPFCKLNLLLFIPPRWQLRTYFFNHYNVLFWWICIHRPSRYQKGKTNADFTEGSDSDRQSPRVLWRCWLGGRKGIRPVKNWVVGCWRGYLSGAKCRLAYGTADATATGRLLLQ